MDLDTIQYTASCPGLANRKPGGLGIDILPRRELMARVILDDLGSRETLQVAPATVVMWTRWLSLVVVHCPLVTT
jgi:hypothetical protein